MDLDKATIAQLAVLNENVAQLKKSIDTLNNYFDELDNIVRIGSKKDPSHEDRLTFIEKTCDERCKVTDKLTTTVNKLLIGNIILGLLVATSLGINNIDLFLKTLSIIFQEDQMNDNQKLDGWKPIIESKVMWTNFIALVALILQLATGTEVLNAETQLGILAIINLILRPITSKTVRW